MQTISITLKGALPIILVIMLQVWNPNANAQCDGVATFTDARDGQTYNQITLGNQCWMAQNLNHGIMIAGASNQTNNGTIERYCYNDLIANCNTHGALYQWNEMMNYAGSDAGNPGTTQGICPTGWHLPSDGEWCTMENTVEAGTDPGCSSTTWRGTNTGGDLKQTGTTLWTAPNNGATNTSGFTAVPGGERNLDGSGFISLGITSAMWSSTERSATTTWDRKLTNGNTTSLRSFDTKTGGMAVRCVRDLPAWPLPVKLLYFKAKWTNENYESATLKWETTSETNNSHFDIEKSTDGIHFDYVKSISGQGTSNQNIAYLTLDEQPYKEGTSYYRLKQIDNNGHFEYSNVEVLNIPDGINWVSLYPNPSVHELNVLITSSIKTSVKVTITNTLGQRVKEVYHTINTGINSLTFDVSELSTGNYLMKIGTTNGEYQIQQKFVKGK